MEFGQGWIKRLSKMGLKILFPEKGNYETISRLLRLEKRHDFYEEVAKRLFPLFYPNGKNNPPSKKNEVYPNKKIKHKSDRETDDQHSIDVKNDFVKDDFFEKIENYRGLIRSFANKVVQKFHQRLETKLGNEDNFSIERETAKGETANQERLLGDKKSLKSRQSREALSSRQSREALSKEIGVSKEGVTYSRSRIFVDRGILTFDDSEFKQKFDDLPFDIFSLCPWRKGPFQIGSQLIDSEWDSNKKWERIEGVLLEKFSKLKFVKNGTKNSAKKSKKNDGFLLKPFYLLDVGCNNGYYLFRLRLALEKLKGFNVPPSTSPKHPQKTNSHLASVDRLGASGVLPRTENGSMFIGNSHFGCGSETKSQWVEKRRSAVKNQAREVVLLGIDPALVCLKQFLFLKNFFGNQDFDGDEFLQEETTRDDIDAKTKKEERMYDAPSQMSDYFSSLGKTSIHFLPIGHEMLDNFLPKFSIILCMGILYHVPNPLGVIRKIYDCLVNDGVAIMELEGIESANANCLFVEKTYHGKKGYWFIPSAHVSMAWFKRMGFRKVSLLDKTVLTGSEQRKTIHANTPSLDEGMKKDERKVGVDPEKSTTKYQKTIEGYPGPIRLTFLVEK